MIYDTLENFPKYFQSDTALFQALSFAHRFDSSNPDGRYEIKGEDIFALVSSYQTSPAGCHSFEIHRRYADVQVVLEGEEAVEVSLSAEVNAVGDYDQKSDKVTLEAPGDLVRLVLRPGCFAVIYPNEAHRPNCDLQGKARVRKMVVKVGMV
ncbi:MAG: YhcH/YjgK/YiaL family protein [Syntrophobacteraceae bacterium]|nr:YhcH/YjgK/YiaL family protein [Syntrophobacteraceae bacterium]